MIVGDWTFPAAEKQSSYKHTPCVQGNRKEGPHEKEHAGKRPGDTESGKQFHVGNLQCDRKSSPGLLCARSAQQMGQQQKKSELYHVPCLADTVPYIS